MRCERAESTLALLAEGVEVDPSDATRHIARCLRCQAALAQHRRMRRTMRTLRARTVEPAPSLLTDILAALDGAASAQDGDRAESPWRRRIVVAVATAATAAGATGAVLWTARSRRPAAG